MKKFSIFLTFLLVILIASLIFVLQNNGTIITLKFLGWSFPDVSAGLFSIIAFFAGFIAMWLISLILYAGSTSHYKKEIKSRDKLIKQLEEEKNLLKKNTDELKKKCDEEKAILSNELKKLKEKAETDEKKTEATNPEKEETKKEEENTAVDVAEKPKKRGLFRRKS